MPGLNGMKRMIGMRVVRVMGGMSKMSVMNGMKRMTSMSCTSFKWQTFVPLDMINMCLA